MLTYACDPRYVGGRDGREQGLKQAWEKVTETLNNLHMVAHVCGPSYLGSIGRTIPSKDGPMQKRETLSEQN